MISTARNPENPSVPFAAAVILCGGKSSRMGTDKALLEFGGDPVVARLSRLLAGVCGQVFLSCRAEQAPALSAHGEIMPDASPGAGPLAAIADALARLSQKGTPGAVLFLACDLPLFDTRAAAELGRAVADAFHPLDEEEPPWDVVAFVDDAGLPEPMASVWRPSPTLLGSLAQFESAWKGRGAGGTPCPRTFLRSIGSRFVPVAATNPAWLTNVNTPELLSLARLLFKESATTPSALTPLRPIEISYFALLRDCAGVSGESLLTSAETPLALYDQLREKYGFPLEPRILRVAVNDAFAHWDVSLNAGDRVVFIPPVAGG